MAMNHRIATILTKHGADLLDKWMQRQLANVATRRDLISDVDLKDESRQFLELFREAVADGGGDDVDGPSWRPLRDLLASISTARARKGFTPSETATFVFSLKEPLFARLRTELAADPSILAEDTIKASVLLDKLGLYTTEVYQKGREEVIARQQRSEERRVGKECRS